ncbi:tyrosine-type recombinase/integrase [Peribacillus glennii]|uniref:tyrosine-type recombinase/integrase n=1 Tax=Peribacillus glennii TaxID=2303991 RepID=UPI0013144EA0
MLGKEYNDMGLVFAQLNGNPIQPSEVAKKFLKIIEAAGLLRIRFHDLRHTHATLMLQQGVILKWYLNA